MFRCCLRLQADCSHLGSKESKLFHILRTKGSPHPREYPPSRSTNSTRDDPKDGAGSTYASGGGAGIRYRWRCEWRCWWEAQAGMVRRWCARRLLLGGKEAGKMASLLSKSMPTYMCSGTQRDDLHMGNSPQTPFPSVKPPLSMWVGFLLPGLWSKNSPS